MILDEIVFNKRQEVTALKVELSEESPRGLIKGLPKPRLFTKNFNKDRLGLIAEVKKASPSAGLIREDFDPIALAKTYEQSGAAAISVLTDSKYFQGSLDDLKAVKAAVKLPVLRKDFIIDEAQVYESRLAGADAILLIARILQDEELGAFLDLAEELGMQALVETHNAEEVERALKVGTTLIGINNRDLDTLKIDLNTTVSLIGKFPKLKKATVISESGVKTPEDVALLRKAGAKGLLIGETLMKSNDIPAKIKELMSNA